MKVEKCGLLSPQLGSPHSHSEHGFSLESNYTALSYSLLHHQPSSGVQDRCHMVPIEIGPIPICEILPSFFWKTQPYPVNPTGFFTNFLKPIYSGFVTSPNCVTSNWFKSTNWFISKMFIILASFLWLVVCLSCAHTISSQQPCEVRQNLAKILIYYTSGSTPAHVSTQFCNIAVYLMKYEFRHSLCL